MMLGAWLRFVHGCWGRGGSSAAAAAAALVTLCSQVETCTCTIEHGRRGVCVLHGQGTVLCCGICAAAGCLTGWFLRVSAQAMEAKCLALLPSAVFLAACRTTLYYVYLMARYTH
jgi:hypothetical protein